jgi:hypothetical protein
VATASGGSVATLLGSQDWLIYAQLDEKARQLTPGIAFTMDVDESQGEFFWVQTVEVMATQTLPDGRSIRWQGEGLDTVYPYGNETQVYDHPGVGLMPYTIAASYEGNFDMYLMFRPKTPGAIETPLVCVEWSFSAQASRLAAGTGSDKWSYLQHATPQPDVEDTTDYPEWTMRLQSSGGGQEWEWDD